MPGETWEDLGYKGERPMADDVYTIHKNKHEDSIRVEYVRGFEEGKIRWLRIDIAEDLIRRGVAVEVKDDVPF